MSIITNGSNIKNIITNSQSVVSVIMNGNVIWGRDIQPVSTGGVEATQDSKGFVVKAGTIVPVTTTTYDEEWIPTSVTTYEPLSEDLTIPTAISNYSDWGESGGISYNQTYVVVSTSSKANRKDAYGGDVQPGGSIQFYDAIGADVEFGMNKGNTTHCNMDMSLYKSSIDSFIPGYLVNTNTLSKRGLCYSLTAGTQYRFNSNTFSGQTRNGNADSDFAGQLLIVIPGSSSNIKASSNAVCIARSDITISSSGNKTISSCQGDFTPSTTGDYSVIPVVFWHLKSVSGSSGDTFWAPSQYGNKVKGYTVTTTKKVDTPLNINFSKRVEYYPGETTLQTMISVHATTDEPYGEQKTIATAQVDDNGNIHDIVNQ